jgi:phosphatidyl-myo-inositol dimannoside synthase
MVGPSNRGLRGWAMEVYSHFVSSALPLRSTPYKSRKRGAVGTVGEAVSFPNAPMREAVSFPNASHASIGREANSFPYSSKPVEVLMLVSDAFGGFGGIAKFNRDFLTALCACPIIKHVIAVPRVATSEAGPLPPKLTYAISALAGKSQFVRAVISAARRLRRSRTKPMIICGHINLLPTAIMARRICGGSLYLIVHGVDAWKPLRNRVVNRCVRLVDNFIAVSSVTRRRFLRWSGLRQDQGIVLPNCVDLSVFTPGPKPKDLITRYGLENRTVLLTLGRLAEEERYKGFDEVLEILPALAKDVPNITYFIVGDGPDRPRLEQKAEELSVADRVVFAGRISDEEKPDHYRLADAYVMPSSGEGFGIVLLEALACGIPVIGSKIDGSRDALRDGSLGLLVNPRNPAELHAAILQALAQGKESAQERLDGVEYFSVERFRQRVFEICRELLGRRGSNNAGKPAPSATARSTVMSAEKL